MKKQQDPKELIMDMLKDKACLKQDIFENTTESFKQLKLVLADIIDEVRDFGNGNNSFADVVLDDYTIFNFSSTYKLFDSYNLFFNAENIFDDKYEQAHQYSSMGRSFNFGIKRAF